MYIHQSTFLSVQISDFPQFSQRRG